MLHLVDEGRTNAEIAHILWVAPSTVRKHLENAYAKLGVSSRTEATALLRREVVSGGLAGDGEAVGGDADRGVAVPADDRRAGEPAADRAVPEASQDRGGGIPPRQALDDRRPARVQGDGADGAEARADERPALEPARRGGVGRAELRRGRRCAGVGDQRRTKGGRQRERRSGRGDGACDASTLEAAEWFRAGLGQGGLCDQSRRRAGGRGGRAAQGRADRAGAADPAQLPGEHPLRPPERRARQQPARARRAATGSRGPPRRSAWPTSSAPSTGRSRTSAACGSEQVEYAGNAERLRDVWVAVRASLRAVLEHVTLADLAAGELPESVQALAADPDAWAPH